MRLKFTYRVHRFDAETGVDEKKLEKFLNGLRGEVAAIVPQHKEDSSEQISSLLVVEKVLWQPWQPLDKASAEVD